MRGWLLIVLFFGGCLSIEIENWCDIFGDGLMFFGLIMYVGIGEVVLVLFERMRIDWMDYKMGVLEILLDEIVVFFFLRNILDFGVWWGSLF